MEASILILIKPLSQLTSKYHLAYAWWSTICSVTSETELLRIFKTYNFDIIINATSCGLYDQFPIFPKGLVTANTICYDISYSRNQSLTPFLRLCQDLGSQNLSDGLGMLVAQAAYSCFFWFGILPNIDKTFNRLKLIL